MTFPAVVYVFYLRSLEVLLLDLKGLRKYNSEKRDEVILLLRGKVKGEANRRMHFMYSVAKTLSRIHVKKWVNILILMQQRARRKAGPALTSIDGSLLKSGDIDGMFCELLCEVWDDHYQLFLAYVMSHEVISERCSVFRILRKSSSTHAIEKRVLEADNDIVNKRNGTKKSKGKRSIEK